MRHWSHVDGSRRDSSAHTYSVEPPLPAQRAIRLRHKTTSTVHMYAFSNVEEVQQLMEQLSYVLINFGKGLK